MKLPHGNELYAGIVFGAGVVLIWGVLAAILILAFILA
jgi:hypothetical protein